MLSDIVFKLSKGDKTLWDIPAEAQRMFMDRLSEPKNDIQRSINQYRCQCLFVPTSKVILRDLLSPFVILFLIVYALTKAPFVKKEKKEKIIGQFYDYRELIPLELKGMRLISNADWGGKMALLPKDLIYIIKSLARYSYRPYFCLKCIINLSKYRYFIIKYHPDIIADHAEFSCTSSFLTQFCNSQHIKHYNVMHGEKLYYIRDSFFRYDRCYVWDNYYKDLFIRLRAESNQFVIEYPKSIINVKEREKKNEMYVDYRYYLQIPTVEQMKSILESMSFAKRLGKTVKYRIHPNHMNIEAVKLIPEEELENPREVDILDSLVNSGHVVGSYTTTLTHAYYAGLNVILDDVTYKDTYLKLKEYEYVLANKNISKLSDFYEEIN